MNTERSKAVVEKYFTKPNRKRLTQEMSATFDAKQHEIGALLCPTREYDWIPIWDCEVIYTESGYAEGSYVFTTDNEVLGTATWICTRYEQNEAAEYVGIGKDIVTRLRMHIIGLPNGKTQCTWEEQITALTDAGDAHIAKIEAEDKDLYEGIPGLIQHYLQTGEMASKEMAKPV